MRNQKFIKIPTIEGIKDFLNAATTMVEGEVFVKRGNYCVDGTSLLGLMSIDISQGCAVDYPSDAKEFDEFLTRFM